MYIVYISDFEFLNNLFVQVGWFPSNYTQEEIDDPHTYCMAENVLDIMVALYQFKEHMHAFILSLCSQS